MGRKNGDSGPTAAIGHPAQVPVELTRSRRGGVDRRVGLVERQEMENVIRGTRTGSKPTQTVGILLEDSVGAVEIGTNQIEASPVVDARRRESSE